MTWELKFGTEVRRVHGGLGQTRVSDSPEGPSPGIFPFSSSRGPSGGRIAAIYNAI